ncbi:hypothetical protein FIBSPDRAFT_861144, partial [Athelia psychrophila]
MIVFGGPHLPLLAVGAHCQCQKYVPSPSLCHHAAHIPRTEKCLLATLQRKCGL